MKPIQFILVVVAFMSMLSFFIGIFLSSDLDMNSNEDVFHSDLFHITSSISIIDNIHNEQEHVQTSEKYNHDKRQKEKEHQQSQEKKDDMKKTKIIPRPSCFDNDKGCRFDTVGKYLESSAIETMIHPPSDALPPIRKIPKEMATNDTYITNKRLLGPSDGSETALFEYNPSIIPLTSDWDETLLSYITGRYHPEISDEEADKVKYIYVARASNLHSCGGEVRKFDNPTKEQSYLSLALLDEDLQAIPGASAVFLPYYELFPKCYQVNTLSVFQDYQIIVMRSSKDNPKKDQLFLYGSDRGSHIFPIDIRRVPNATNDVTNWKTKIKSKTFAKMIHDEKELSHLYYGQGLQVRFMDDLFPIEERGKCDAYLRYHAADVKKNYHFFEIPDENGINGVSTYMELRPHWTRETRKVNFYAEKFEKHTDWELVINGTYINRVKGKRSEIDVVKNLSRRGEAKEQFSAIQTSWEEEKGRGTACCVDIDLDDKKSFKVGISHATIKGKGYVSRFYAFCPKAPHFHIVAMSGPLCFSGMDKQDKNFESQIFNVDSNSLNDNSTWYECPKVTFASDIAEYQKDRNYVIISYGVGDCYSRSVVVSKSRINELLDVKGDRSWMDNKCYD